MRSFGLTYKIIVHLKLPKIAERSEAKSAFANHRVKISRNFIFDAKLCSALLASLRSAMFGEFKMNDYLVN